VQAVGSLNLQQQQAQALMLGTTPLLSRHLQVRTIKRACSASRAQAMDQPSVPFASLMQLPLLRTHLHTDTASRHSQMKLQPFARERSDHTLLPYKCHECEAEGESCGEQQVRVRPEQTRTGTFQRLASSTSLRYALSQHLFMSAAELN
jgi:hypothetical protein